MDDKTIEERTRRVAEALIPEFARNELRVAVKMRMIAAGVALEPPAPAD